MMYNDYGYWIVSYIFALLIMLGVIVLIVLGILILSKYLNNLGRKTMSNAIERLNERYIRGEITSEEYNRMKAEILRKKGKKT